MPLIVDCDGVLLCLKVMASYVVGVDSLLYRGLNQYVVLYFCCVPLSMVQICSAMTTQVGEAGGGRVCHNYCEHCSSQHLFANMHTFALL